jgi:hypothetical protein
MNNLHMFSEHANSTIKWISPDDQERYKSNLSNPTSRQQLDNFNWIDVDIDYQFNSDGFRGENFTQGECLAALGCSFTFGVGVNYKDTWINKIEEKLGIRCWNLGVSGAAGDTCYRIAKAYLSKLNPKVVVYLEPRYNRVELFTGSNKIPNLVNWAYDYANYGGGVYVKEWLAVDQNQQLYAEKNRLSIKMLCQDIGAEVISYKPKDFVELVKNKQMLDLGRDLLHPGRLNHIAFSEVVIDDIKKIL